MGFLHVAAAAAAARLPFLSPRPGTEAEGREARIEFHATTCFCFAGGRLKH